MTRKFWVTGDRTFTIEVPDNAKVTYAPFSPPPSRTDRNNYQEWAEGAKRGTLRIYRTEKDILACFSGVTMFRDMSLEYTEITDAAEIPRGMAGYKGTDNEDDDLDDDDIDPPQRPIAKRRIKRPPPVGTSTF